MSGTIEVGGLIGFLQVGKVDRCYSAGAVSGTGAGVGGLIGVKATTALVSVSYWDTQVSGRPSSAGGEGRTSAQMKYPHASGTYVGWNFTSTWISDVSSSANNGYPYLQIAVSKPNLTPYKPNAWSDKIVVSTVPGTSNDAAVIYSTDSLYIDFAVLNTGPAAVTSAWHMGLYVNGVLVTNRNGSVPLWSNYYTYVRDNMIGPLAAGAHTLKLVADSGQVIAETSESDNEYSRTILVIARVKNIFSDFDGDGRSDYGVYFAPQGSWFRMLSKDGFKTTQFGFGGTLPIVGDWDGDGLADYGCYHPPSGNWYRMLSKDGFKVTQFGFDGTLPIVGDWDGDGKDDYGCYYPPPGTWYRMMSKDGFKITQFGFGGTLPIVGDWDGDGKDDYGCYYPPSGTWYRMMSKDGFQTTQFGFGGTLPIVGDWDGDGKDDYGCYHPPTGNWYRMMSKDGFKTTQFGFIGTLPIVGDWDGDGKDDYGCYHPASGTWYRMMSKDGFKTTQFGFSGTVPLGR